MMEVEVLECGDSEHDQYGNDFPDAVRHGVLWRRDDGLVLYLDRNKDGTIGTCATYEMQGHDGPKDAFTPKILCALHKALADYEKEIEYEQQS